MKTQSPDTQPEVEQVQIELFRKAGSARRFNLARSLSQTAIELSRRAIRRQHPDASEEEVRLIWVALHYGQELADRVRADLEGRRR